MPSSTLQRVRRLDAIAARLKSEDELTVARVADELGVSVRTLTRDIEILREQGLPIEAARGRGGGIRLRRDWGVGRVAFTHAQSVELLVCLAVSEQVGSPLFARELGKIRDKLLASLTPETKRRTRGLKKRILVSQAASHGVQATYRAPRSRVIEALYLAFVHERSAEIAYRKEGERLGVRTIDPHYLVLCSPVWYVIAWDHLRAAPRTFRCDRIEKLQVLERSFSMAPLARFSQALEGIEFIFP